MKSLNSADVIACVNLNYPLFIDELRPHLSSADPDARAFIAKGAKESFFIKVKRSGLSKTNTILSFLAKNGINEIILPLDNRFGSGYTSFLEYELAVFPYISGQDGFHKTLTDNQWTRFGTLLKKIHQLDPTTIQPIVRNENLTAQNLLQSKIYNEDAKDRGVDFDTESIDRLIEKVSALEPTVKNKLLKPCFCHGDIHGGNLLISDSGNLFIVDWDDPIIGPKELDLMFIGGGVENVWNKAEETQVFYSGYGTSAFDADLLAYIRSRRILDDFVFYYPELYQNKGSDLMYKHFLNMFKPNGVIEIALNT